MTEQTMQQEQTKLKLDDDARRALAQVYRLLLTLPTNPRTTSTWLNKRRSNTMNSLIEVGPKVDSWSAPQIVPAEETVPVEMTTLDKARQEMEDRVAEHLVRGEPGLLIVTGIPGLGKTTITVQQSEKVAEETGTNIAWFGTRHDQFDAVPRSAEWRHVMGRNEDNCPHWEAARAIAAKGWSVTGVLCGNGKTPGWCSIGRADCDWWRQWKGDVHRYMPSQHLPAAPLWDRPDLRLVFDELDAAHFAPELVPIGFEALRRAAEAWPQVRAVFGQLKDFLFESGSGWLADTPLYEVLWSALDDIPYHVPNVNLPEEAPDADQLPSRHVLGLLEQLSKELWRYRRGDEFVSRVGVNDGRFVYYPPMDLPDAVFSHPAVLLNSTANVDALRHLLESMGYPVEVYSPPVGLHPETEVGYILDANHSKSTVEQAGDDYSERWYERIRDATDGNQKTLVLATKRDETRLEEVLSGLVGEQIELAHYGAVSGLNEYEDADGLVLSQPFNPSRVAVAQLYRRIYGGRRGQPLTLDTCYRLARLAAIPGKKHTYQVTVTSMADERLAPLYERWRWAEMYQAAHRVRPALYKRRITVTCAIPLPGLAPTAASYSSRRTETTAQLEEAAARLLAQEGHFTQKELAYEADFDVSTVSRHWNQLIQEMGLTIVQVAVPSPRYPNGRTAKAATHACTSS